MDESSFGELYERIGHHSVAGYCTRAACRISEQIRAELTVAASNQAGDLP
jgi:hypothetical protein